MKTTKKKFRLILTVLVILTLSIGFFFFNNNPETASATWWNDSWSYRKTLTINSDQVAGDLTNFPVLVSLTDSDFINHAQEDGDDFVFIDTAGKKLAHEIESYASSTGKLVAWVKAENLSGTEDTQINMYYGNAGVESQEDTVNVWDDDYVGVWHLPIDSLASTTDSSQFGHNGRMVNDAVATSSGKIGGGVYFDGTDDYLEVLNQPSLDGLTVITMCSWIKPTAINSTYPAVISHQDATDGWDLYLNFSFSGESLGTSYRTTSDYAYAENGSAGLITNNNWHYVCAVQNGEGSSNMLLYHNDTSLAITRTGNENARVNDSGNDLRFGSALSGSSDFEGYFDEVRVSKIVRSATWLETEFNNQNDPASFFAEGTEEVGPGPVGYWSFDEGYGTVVHDESGQGNDGTVVGATWVEDSQCISGKCLYFDGTNDSVMVSDADVLDLTENFTICAWTKRISIATNEAILSKVSAYKLDTDATDRFRFTTLGVRDYEADKVQEINKWYFYCAVMDSSYDVAFYVDGNYVSTENGGSAGNISSNELYFGTSNPNYYHGYIDEVKIYPYTRTADQIKQDYNAGLAGVSSDKGVAVAFGSNSEKWMSDGLVGYWKFDESATTSGAVDSSGNGNDGTYYGDASTTAGKFGNGYEGDGTEDWVDFGTDDFDLADNGEVSISLWLRLKEDLSSSEALVQRGQYVYPFSMDIDNGENINFAIREEGSGVTYLEVSDSLSLDTWYHIVGTYRNDEGMKLYVNGEFDISNNLSVELDNTGGQSTYVGNYPNATSEGFPGQIDEVRIYNRSLSPDEVKKLHEWAPGPVAHWKFDEYGGTTAYDSVASSSFTGGNDGTLGGDGLGTDLPSWKKGKYGSALQFDGSDDFIQTGPNPKLSSGQGTISFWMKYTAWGSGSYYPIEIYDTLYNDFLLIGLNGVSHAFSMTAEDGNTDVLSVWYDLDDLDDSFQEKWYHISWVQDGVSPKLYIDGIEKTLNKTIDSGYWTDHLSVENITIGKSAWGEFEGYIDDMRIYNYARTQKQILEDMNGGKPALKAPILDLNFDEGRGATAYDSSGHGNNGSLQPGTGGTNTASSSMWTTDGRVKGSMEFDGTDDYVDVGTISALSNDTETTVSLWMKKDSNTLGYLYYSLTRPYLYSSTNIRWRTSTANAESDTLNIGQWYHVVGTFRDSSSKLYIDGELVSSVTDTMGGGSDVTIGTDTNGGSHFDGQIDEVKIWNYALNSSEVKQIYNDSKGAVLGSTGASSDTATSSSAKSREYCVPGDTAQCNPPVLELKFDEYAGTTAYDTSGNGNDGTLGDGSSYVPTWSALGKKGSALSFDDTDDYVIVTDPGTSVLDITGELTISAWVKRNVMTGQDVILSKYDSSGGTAENYGFAVDGDELEFGYYNSGWHTQHSVDANLVAGRWYYVSVTYDDTANDIIFYVDGVAQSDTDVSGDAENTSILADDKPLYIGNVYANGYPFDGLIDEIKIYNYARTPAQIAWEYNKGGPIAHYKFDECRGSTIYDSSGNANHGSLNLGASGVTATGTCASSSNSFWYNGRTGKKNSAGSFDGNDDYIVVSDSNSLDISGNISISVWFKAETDTTGYFLTKGLPSGSNPQNYQFYTYGGTVSKSVEFDYYTGGWNDTVTPENSISLNAWQHALVTQDGSNTKIYINGELIQNDVESTALTVNSESLWIGGTSSGTNFDGFIDEVKIWNYALTDDQIKTEYNMGAVKFGN